MYSFFSSLRYWLSFIIRNANRKDFSKSMFSIVISFHLSVISYFETATQNAAIPFRNTEPMLGYLADLFRSFRPAFLYLLETRTSPRTIRRSEISDLRPAVWMVARMAPF